MAASPTAGVADAPRAARTLDVRVDAALRILAGLMFVPHGTSLLFGWFGGAGWRASGPLFEQAFGLAPGHAWALAAGLVEIVGGLLLAAGAYTRVAAAAVVVLLAVAATVLADKGWFWHLGGIEYHVLWAAVVTSYAIKGAGPLSWDGRRERRA